MLTLDQFSESVLFQCDRCRFVGELFIDIVEEEGSYNCWNCLSQMILEKKSKSQEREHMLLNEKSLQGEPLFECDECHTIGEIGTIFVDEKGLHHCLTCWSQQNQKRSSQSRLAVIEK